MVASRLADAVPLAPGARLRTDLLDPTCRSCAAGPVPPEGPDRPLVFFVGEAPGPDEDRLGRPFVGRAGRMLRSCLTRAGWDPGTVWITNIVKRFPFDVEGDKRRIRPPTQAEVTQCMRHLAREFQEAAPRVAVALGRTAAQGLLGRKIGALTPLRRTVQPARAELAGIPVFITHHPSALFYGKLRGQEEGFVADLRAAHAWAESRGA